MAVPMTERIALERNEKLRHLHHEIQNCLSVISMGTDTLEKFRHDDTIFAEFYQSIQEHRRKATELVDEFLKRTCDECK